MLLKIYTSIFLVKAANSYWLFGTALQETAETIGWENLVLWAKSSDTSKNKLINLLEAHI